MSIRENKPTEKLVQESNGVYSTEEGILIAGIERQEEAKREIRNRVGKIIRESAMDENEKIELNADFDDFFNDCWNIYAKYGKTTDESIEIKAVRFVGEGAFEPVRTIYEKYKALTDKEKDTLFILGKEYIFLSMSSIALFRRAVHSFPLLSNLKRLLLQTRRGTALSQCAFVLDQFQKKKIKDIGKRTEMELKQAESSQIHNDISNDTLSETIEKLVNLYVSTSGQFKNTLKVWFNYDKATQPQAETLYKVAFALRLDHTAFLDDMVSDVQGFEWNVWNEKECIYLFCLTMGFSFQYASDLIERYHKEIAIQGITKKTRAAKDDILDFLNRNYPDEIKEAAKDPKNDDKTVTEFLRLLGSLGIGRNYNPQETERLNLAREQISGIYTMLDQKANDELTVVDAIRSKYEELKYVLPNSQIHEGDQNYKHLKEKITSIIQIYKDNNFPQFKKNKKENCETDPERILDYLLREIEKYDAKEFFKPGCNNEKAKASLLEYLTDGSCYYTIDQIAGSGFSSKKINQLMNGNAVSVDRAFFMRLAYLPPLIRLLSKPDFSVQDALNEFQKNAEALMKQAEFATPNFLYPHDLLLFQSFTAQDFNLPAESNGVVPEPVLPPFVYQCFLPRSAKLNS